MSDEKKKIEITEYDQKKFRIVEKICVIVGLAAGAFLCVATVMMFINICTRTVADHTFIFIYELCGLCAAGVASLTIPYATFRSGHTTMDTVLGKMKPRVRSTFEGISGVISLVILAFTIYSVGVTAVAKTKVFEATTTAHLPTWIFRWVFIIGLVLTLVAAAVETVDMFRRVKGVKVYVTAEEAAEAQKALDGEGEEVAE